MRTATITLAVLMMISLASATINLFSGESYSFESEQFDYWEVVGNVSDLEGMNISYENGNITISFDPMFKSDSFTILFWGDYEVIDEYHYTGGGGRRRTVLEEDNTTLSNVIYEEGDETETDETTEELEDETQEDETQEDNYKFVLIITLVLCAILMSLIVIMKKPKYLNTIKTALSKMKGGIKQK